MDVPETRYARSGDLQIAYQVVGEGRLDVVLIPSYLSNIELFWELPSSSRFFERLSSFYSPEEIVELTCTIAFENFLSKFHHTLLVESQGFCPVVLGRATPS